MAILKTEDLTYQYSIGTPFEKTAVDHVNLEIEEGAFVGIIGHTGSGKSILIEHFLGRQDTYPASSLSSGFGIPISGISDF